MYKLTVSEYLQELANQGFMLGMFLVVAGIVFMLLGVRIFRTLIALSFGGIGYVLGNNLPVSDMMQIVLGIVGAIGMAALSMVATKLAVALLAGGWVGILVFALTTEIGFNEQVVLALSCFAAAAGIALTFILFQEIIAFITSLEGSLLLVSGLATVFSQSPMLWSHIRGMLVGNPVFAPFIIMAGTITGFYLQLADLQTKDTGANV